MNSLNPDTAKTTNRIKHPIRNMMGKSPSFSVDKNEMSNISNITLNNVSITVNCQLMNSLELYKSLGATTSWLLVMPRFFNTFFAPVIL